MKKIQQKKTHKALPPASWLVELSRIGRMSNTNSEAETLVNEIGLGESIQLTTNLTTTPHKKEHITLAKAYLYTLGPCKDEIGVLRKVTALLPEYRHHLLMQIQEALKCFSDDKALASTLECLDHLSPELLQIQKGTNPPPGNKYFPIWDREVWQSPDAVTLLSKVVESPSDFPENPTGLNPMVCFTWLEQKERLSESAPAPWGNREPLHAPLDTAKHPFWGALSATLDACAGDYEWQAMDLRTDSIRHNHIRIGQAQQTLDILWQQELGLFPAAPLLLPEKMQWRPTEEPEWLEYALERMQESGRAVEVAGSWRLSDNFRRELMQNDERMHTFELLRQRAYALARAAKQMAEEKREKKE